MANKTKQPVKTEKVPYFFLVTEEYALGLPRVIDASDNTWDVKFEDLAKDYDLQEKLKLASAAFIRPHFRPPICYPSVGRELVEHVAGFLAAFTDNAAESKQIRNYLVNNGLVRILVTNPKLKRNLDELQLKRDKEAIHHKLQEYERGFLPSPDHESTYRAGTGLITNQPIFRRKQFLG